MKKFLTVMLCLILVFSFTTTAFAYTVNITIEPDGGGTVNGSGTYESGKNAVLTATPAEGFSFLGWFSSKSPDTPISTELEYTYDLEADRNFIAKFGKKYDVSIENIPSEGGSTTGAGQYSPGEQVTLTAQPNEGYKFVGWFQTDDTEPVSTEPSYTITIGETNVALTAKFTVNYKLTVTAEPPNFGVVLGGGEFAGGSVVSVEAKPAESYRFVGWVDITNPDTIIDKNTTMVLNLDSDRHFIAKFEKGLGSTIGWMILIIACCVAGAFGIFVFIKRTMVIRRRTHRRYRRRR